MDQNDILNTLFHPKMLFNLVILWILFVVVGTGLAMLSSQNSFLSDGESERIIEDTQRLSDTTNVAVQEEGQTAVFSGPPVFPDRLIVEGINIDLPISNPQTRDIGALDEKLKDSVVRYPDSATLGVQGGNVLVFGHSSGLPVVRNQFFKAFNKIKDLEDGQIIKAVSGSDTYSYSVSRVYQASATDDRIALNVAGHRITLLTCDSFGSKSDRWVVEAEFIGKNL